MTLGLGDMTAIRDWGYAPDYVEAMWRMLQQDTPGDYVIATGEPHTVEDFAREAFAAAGLDYREHVHTDERQIRPLEVTRLCGDPRKAEMLLGWRPTVRFAELVRLMVAADMECSR